MHIEEFEPIIQTSVNKMTTHNDGYGQFQYDKPSSINPFSLIYEVKKYHVLYNKQLPEYASAPTRDKEKVWELIHAVLIPNYEELSEEIKDVVRTSVRKRWKSLRDALVKDNRLRTESAEYREKKMTATVKEMQFLIPHIKYSRKQNDDSSDGKDSPDFCSLMNNDTTIDLTFHEGPEYSHVQIDDDEIISNEALYPSVHLTTPGTFADAYNNAIMNYTIREVEEPETTNLQKRKRTNSEEDLHSKLNELIDRSNEDSHDEDRMFLLSLLSDFKRVPVNKKLKVKSAFVTALYEALD